MSYINLPFIIWDYFPPLAIFIKNMSKRQVKCSNLRRVCETLLMNTSGTKTGVLCKT